MVRNGSGIGFQPRSIALIDDPDIAYLSLSPRYYLNLCVVTKKGTVLSESERYFIYLMIQNDLHVPYYTPDFNEAARNIWMNFTQKEVPYDLSHPGYIIAIAEENPSQRLQTVCSCRSLR